MTDHLGYILAVVSLTLMIVSFVAYVIERLWGGKK